jgi:hypothetical protein
MSATLADHVLAVWRQVEALPRSEEKARLQIKLGNVATALARRVSAAAAKRKEPK